MILFGMLFWMVIWVDMGRIEINFRFEIVI